MKINDKAIEHAKSLILAGKVNTESNWSEAQPNAEKENEFREDHDWEGYGKWYLVTNDKENATTKAHYAFPYVDFDTIHRSALKAAKQRAAQHGYDAIEQSIDELLIEIDKRPDAVTEASLESFPASDPPNWRDSDRSE